MTVEQIKMFTPFLLFAFQNFNFRPLYLHNSAVILRQIYFAAIYFLLAAIFARLLYPFYS